MTTPQHQPSHVAVGRIARPHGVHGELRVEPLTEDPNRFDHLTTVYVGQSLGKPLEPLEVAGFRFHHTYLLIRFQGINSREKAERLRSLTIFVPFNETIPLAEGEFFIFQLYGMAVVTTDGQSLGTVREVLQTGANDVFVVDGGPYGEVLLPDIEDVVLAINSNQRVITVTLLPGLLPGSDSAA